MRSTSHVLGFGGASVEILAFGPLSAQLLEFLFAELPAQDPVDSHTTFRLVPGIEADELTLYRDRQFVFDGPVGTMANVLVGEVIFHLANRGTGGALLHAAAVADDAGRAIVMPGHTGAGKTTLAAWLMESGMQYLTDELVFIPEDDTRVHAFTRPLTVKTAGMDLFSDRVDFSGRAAELMTAREAVLVPPRLLGSVREAPESRIGAFVFPRFDPAATTEVRPLTAAQTGLLLMGSLINARNLPGHGFPQITRLARTIPGYELGYESIDAIGDRLPRLSRGTHDNDVEAAGIGLKGG